MGEAWLDEFVGEVAQTFGPKVGAIAGRTFEAFRELDLSVKRQRPVPTKGLGVGIVEPSIMSWNATLLVGHSRGGIGWELLRLRKHNPFSIKAKEDELRAMLQVIPGYIDRPDYPAVSWTGLAEKGFEPFIAAVSWTADRVRGANPGG